jgi:hypothetical protein
MTGSTGNIVFIVIIPVVALAFWLVMIFRANSHPRWGRQAPPDTAVTHALDSSIPAQRLSSSGPVVPGQRSGTAAEEAATGTSAIRTG